MGDLPNALSARYGSDGYITHALLDLERNRESAPAAQIAMTFAPIGSDVDAHEHAWEIIAGMADDAYTNAKEMLASMSWQTLVDVGAVPAILDEMIAHLKNVSLEVGAKLKRSVTWITGKIQQLWNYARSLLLTKEQQSRLDVFLSKISFGALANTAVAYAMRTIKVVADAALVFVRELRSLVHRAIEYMTVAVGGAMRAITALPEDVAIGTKRHISHMLFFYTSASADMPRYAASTGAAVLSRVQSFKTQHQQMLGQLDNLQRKEIPENVRADLLEKEILVHTDQNPYYAFLRDAFSGQRIASWILEKLTWLRKTIKQLFSAAYAVINSIFHFGLLLLSSDRGHFLTACTEAAIADSAQQSDVARLRDNIDSLLEVPTLSDATRTALTQSKSLAEEAVYLFQLHNARLVTARDGAPSDQQFRANHDVAALLTKLYHDDGLSNDDDDQMLRRVLDEYAPEGADALSAYIARETITRNLEIQTNRAFFEVTRDLSAIVLGGREKKGMEASISPIGAGNNGDGDDSVTTLELQNAFSDAEDAYERARAHFQTVRKDHGILITGTTMEAQAVAIAESYMQALPSIERGQQEALSAISTTQGFTQFVQSVLLTGNRSKEQQFMDAFFGLLRAFYKRQELAKQLEVRLEAPNRLKGKIRIASAILVAGAVAFMYFAIANYTAPADILGAARPEGAGPYWAPDPSVLERKLASERGRMSTVLQLFAAGLEKTGAMDVGRSALAFLKSTSGTTNLNVLSTLNLHTWIQVMRDILGNVGVTSALKIPLVYDYAAVAIAAVPITLAAAAHAYFALSCFGCMLVDMYYDVGVETTERMRPSTRRSADPQAKPVTRVRFTRNRWWYYLLYVGASSTETFKYAFVKGATCVVSLIFGKIEALSAAVTAIPLLISSGNPIPRLAEYVGGKFFRDSQELETFANKFTLLPGRATYDAILQRNEPLGPFTYESSYVLCESVRELLSDLSNEDRGAIAEQAALISRERILELGGQVRELGWEMQEADERYLQLKYGSPDVEEVEEEEDQEE